MRASIFAAIKLSLAYLKPEIAPKTFFPLVALPYSLVQYLLIPLSSTYTRSFIDIFSNSSLNFLRFSSSLSL